MSEEQVPVKNAAAVEYYVKEWGDEGSLGWIARELARRVGITVSEALLFLNWVERFATNKELRDQNDRADELLPLQMKLLKQYEKDMDVEKGWSGE